MADLSAADHSSVSSTAAHARFCVFQFGKVYTYTGEFVATEYGTVLM